MGPAPSLIANFKGMYRFNLLLKTNDMRKNLSKANYSNGTNSNHGSPDIGDGSRGGDITRDNCAGNEHKTARRSCRSAD